MSTDGRQPRELRLLTYNVRRLRDDRAAVQRVLRAARPDVVCFQEAPGGALWRQRCSRLARDADLLFVAGGPPAAGNMLATAARVDVLGTADTGLSRTPRMQRRGVTSALLALAGTKFGVIGVHGGLSAAERKRHAGEIHAVADRLRARGAVGVIVAGDLNSPPDRAEWGVLRPFTDAYAAAPSGSALTYPAKDPAHRIDVVLAQPPIEVVSAGVFDWPDAAAASDHLPVLAVLRLS